MNIDLDEAVPVTPVNRVYKSDGTMSYDYKFDKVYLGDLKGNLESVFGDIDSTYKFIDDGLYYKYHGRCGIYIKEHKVYSLDKSRLSDAKEQAYYALSIMESKGFVKGFKRR